MRELSLEELSALVARHEEEVMCTRCKEWTSYGESCCGVTECETGCPACIEAGYQ